MNRKVCEVKKKCTDDMLVENALHLQMCHKC